MYTRHNEVPIYELRRGELPAINFNHVQVALNRLGEPLRLELPRLRTLDLLLQRDAWILVDRALNDFPVVAWCEFETVQRTTLHKPIPCSLRFFHAHGEMILTRVLEAMEMLLGEQLDTGDGDQPAGVVEFKPPEDKG